MTLRSVIAQSNTRIFLRSTDQLAEDVTYHPQGDATGFSCRVVAGVPDHAYIIQDADVRDRQTIRAFANLADIMSGILARVADDRRPRRGDYLTFPDGSDFVGTWVVTSATVDGHGGVDLDLKSERIHAAGGADKQKVE